MEAPVATMQAVKNKEAVADSKDNNTETRMNTSKNNGIILEKGLQANESKNKPIPPSQESQETQNSQSTVDENNETASTPPTSDGFSSQSQESQLSQLSAVAATQESFTATSAYLPSTGQKRTASGVIKSTVAKSPKSAVGGGHSRSTSNISSSSNVNNRIGELSAELRARLSYAALKVNNGWQGLPIDEVESLASQAASPTSSTSTLQGRRNRITSPRATIASQQSENAAARPFSSSAPVLGASNSLASLTTEQPSRTYESFWAEHSVNSNPMTSRYSPFQPHPSLAPPVDITSTSTASRKIYQHPRRNPYLKTSRPPVMPIHTVSDLSQSSTTSPHTPTKDPTIDTMLRTPSQKSIQEQDAIETLLFMSSPGNPTNALHSFPPPQQHSNHRSPLRSEFKATTISSSSQKHKSNLSNHSGHRNRKVGFSGEGEKVFGANRIESGEGRPRRKDGDEVDRMLDEMGEVSSDDEEIEIVEVSRRRAVA